MALVAVKSSNRDLLTDSTSGLSVELAAGRLDPRDALRDINRHLERNRLKDAERAYLEGVKRQLIIREFARSALEAQSYKFPHGARGDKSEEWQRLTAGQTGIPVIDACVQDLNGGLPHNRARLLLARYAIRNLNLDPVMVAGWYKSHLADYCPVINTFNVVSAASGAVFAEPPYRLSNPVTAARKLDPKGDYAARFGLGDRPVSEWGARSIQTGSALWKQRWQSARDNNTFIRRSLWPLQDRERGMYFILDRIPARGAFAPYFRQYLRAEHGFLQST